MTVRVSFSPRRGLRLFLLVVGLFCVSLYGWVFLYSKAYQLWENWRFDQELNAPAVASTAPSTTRAKKASPPATRLKPSSFIGRVSVPRLHLSAIVEEGTDDSTLRRAVGHVPSTVLPGAKGNVAIAGHRDSFFSDLKDLKRGDEIVFETERGRFRYVVDDLSVVEPTNVSVLLSGQGNTLTLITCFPFHYIGPAPRRFIARAHQISESAPLRAALP